MRVIDIHSGDILVDVKKYENILIYNISYANFIGSIPFHVSSMK